MIVNPAAGRGAVRRRIHDLRAAFQAEGISDFQETRAAGDEEEIAELAIHRGVETIVAVGGDGTCTRIANAVLKGGTACRLAVVPMGTGNDFAKTLGVANFNPKQIAALIRGGAAVSIDVGLADGRYFLNSCGFGFDASVLEASSRVRFLKGDAVYMYSALTQLFSYRGINVSSNGAPGVRRGNMLMVTVSNGRFLGGAFMIAPRASVLDGKLDACFFSDAGVVERLRLFAGAMRGTHLEMPAVSSVSVQQLTLTFANKPAMEMDGELRTAGSKSVQLQCVPRALSVFAAPGCLK